MREASLHPSGQDARRTAVRRKRYPLTDAMGLPLAVNVHPAEVQVRDSAEPLLHEVSQLFPLVACIIGDNRGLRQHDHEPHDASVAGRKMLN